MTKFEKSVLFALSLALTGIGVLIRLQFGANTGEVYVPAMGVKDELDKASDYLKRVAEE